MGNFGRKLISPAGFVILVCFFLPWVTVSCGGGKTAITETSAYTILRGIEDGQRSQPGNADFYLIIGGAIVLVLVGLVLWDKRSAGLSVVAVLSSLAALATTLNFYFGLPRAIAESTAVSIQQFSIEWHPAFWATVGAGALALLGSLLSFGSENNP